MHNALQNGENEVDLSSVKFVTPLAILPLAVYANNNGIKINCTEDPYVDACSYFDTIGFQNGVTEFQKVDKTLSPNNKTINKRKEQNTLVNMKKECCLKWVFRQLF